MTRARYMSILKFQYFHISTDCESIREGETRADSAK